MDEPVGRPWRPPACRLIDCAVTLTANHPPALAMSLRARYAVSNENLKPSKETQALCDKVIGVVGKAQRSTSFGFFPLCVSGPPP